MKFLAVFLLIGLVVCAHGVTLREKLRELLTKSNAGSDLFHHHHHGSGHCVCRAHGCWCRGVDDDVKVQAVLSVDETRHCHCKETVISGTFFVGKEWFEEEFPVDQFENFCKEVGNKKFCFEVDVNDTNKSTLRGCLRLTHPERVNMGCFHLPLMTSSDVLDSFQDHVDQNAGLPAIGMEAPTQLDTSLDRCRRICNCITHGCACQGMDDGYKVFVILIVYEIHHDGGSRHAVIQGRFLINKVFFIKYFYESEDLDDFCHMAEGKKFCFDIDAHRLLSGSIKGHIDLTKPKKVYLGCFKIPLLTSSSASPSVDDDDATIYQAEVPNYDDEDAEDNESLIFIDEY